MTQLHILFVLWTDFECGSTRGENVKEFFIALIKLTHKNLTIIKIMTA